MKQKQIAYDCVNCATEICPNNDDPAIIIAKYLSPHSSDFEVPIDNKLNRRVMMLCENCPEYVRFKNNNKR